MRACVRGEDSLRGRLLGTRNAIGARFGDPAILVGALELGEFKLWILLVTAASLQYSCREMRIVGNLLSAVGWGEVACCIVAHADNP